MQQLLRWPWTSRTPLHQPFTRPPVMTECPTASQTATINRGNPPGTLRCPRRRERRSLARQMTAAAGPLSYAKMAATPQGGYLEEESEDSIADQDAAPPASPGTAQPPMHQALSPFSTESLLGSLQTGLPSTPYAGSQHRHASCWE